MDSIGVQKSDMNRPYRCRAKARGYMSGFVAGRRRNRALGVPVVVLAPAQAGSKYLAMQLPFLGTAS